MSTYAPGDVVNGHRLNEDGTAWIPVEQPMAAPAPPTLTAQAKPGLSRGKKIVLGVGGGLVALMAIGAVVGETPESADPVAAVAIDSNASEATDKADQEAAEKAEQEAAEKAEQEAAEKAEQEAAEKAEQEAAEKAAAEEAAKPKVTRAQENALRAAESYLSAMAFSRQGLIDQLSSEYGSGFDVADAKWAVSELDVDWNKQAVRAAESYLDAMAFSRRGLIDQLSSEYGSQFTKAQATYAVDHLGL